MQFQLLRTQLEYFLAAPEIPFNEISKPVVTPEQQEVQSQQEAVLKAFLLIYCSNLSTY